MRITSPVFQPHGTIPRKYTCDGEDVSPPLWFEDVPAQTRSLALIVDDPDAPGKTWVHWVVYDLPALSSLDVGTVPPGKQGVNEFRKSNYGGPCPPGGMHRYVFKLYALDRTLELEEGQDKATVAKAMEGHVLERSERVGTYSRG